VCLLQDQAGSKVDAALEEGGHELQHLAQLLSGQRLAAAVSLASASGDIRLAMLICQVNVHQTLQLWVIHGADKWAPRMEEVKLTSRNILTVAADGLLAAVMHDGSLVSSALELWKAAMCVWDTVCSHVDIHSWSGKENALADNLHAICAVSTLDHPGKVPAYMPAVWNSASWSVVSQPLLVSIDYNWVAEGQGA